MVLSAAPGHWRHLLAKAATWRLDGYLESLTSPCGGCWVSTLGSLSAVSGNTRPWHLTWVSQCMVADFQAWKAEPCTSVKSHAEGAWELADVGEWMRDGLVGDRALKRLMYQHSDVMSESQRPSRNWLQQRLPVKPRAKKAETHSSWGTHWTDSSLSETWASDSVGNPPSTR